MDASGITRAVPMRLGSETAGVVTEVAGGVLGPGGLIRAADAAAAHRALATSHAHGKIILVP